MPDQATIDTYNKYAQVYDQEVMEFWENFPKDFLKRLADNLPGKRVLNVGSGSGRDAVLLKELGLEVVCVDASQSMVDITAGLGFESHMADFSRINFPDASFDGIWAYTSLIHIPKDDAREAINKLHTLLKPSGMFAIGVIEGDSEGMVERKTMPGAARYFKNYSSYELKKMIEPLGFRFQFEQTYQPHNSVYLNQIYVIS